jgi:hypothetical protein
MDVGDSPANYVSAAFATSDGRSILERFAAKVRGSVDPKCLQANRIDNARLADISRSIFERSGTTAHEHWLKAVNIDVYEAEVSRQAGNGVKRELERLRKVPEVRKLVELEQDSRFSIILYYTVENVTRYFTVQRIRLSKAIFPELMGDPLLVSPEEKEVEKRKETLKAFAVESNSPQVKRYFALSEIAREARAKALDQTVLAQLTINGMFADLADQFSALCLLPGR